MIKSLFGRKINGPDIRDVPVFQYFRDFKKSRKTGKIIARYRQSDMLKLFLLAIFIIVGTFPEYSWNYSTGIDNSLKWVFNSLFMTGLSRGKGIIFPHGPLAYFVYPLAGTVVQVVIVTSLLKACLVFVISGLTGRKHGQQWLILFTAAYLISAIANFQNLILVNILLLYCNYFLEERFFLKLTAFILTVFAFYIKSYLVVTALTLYVSFAAFYFFRDKDYKKSCIDLVIVPALILLGWFILYGTLAGFFTYITGIYQLTMDNSAAASLYPENNWWLLSPFLVVVFALPFISKSRQGSYFGLLTLLTIFATWKYGMSREDIFHVSSFIILITIFLVIFILFENQHQYRNLILAMGVVCLVTVNSRNAAAYRPKPVELFRVNSMIGFLTDFNMLKSKGAVQSRHNIASSLLPVAIRDSIGKATVDAYPWDYAVIAANNLTWQPRVVIQSYASYTPWLDNKNAAHFSSGQAPTYLIWDLVKWPGNRADGQFASIDNRYLLNDEPQTLLRILCNYSFYYADAKFLVLKKRLTNLGAAASCLRTDEGTWGQWLDVPFNQQGLLRAKFSCGKSFLQRLKSFLYKDEECLVFLKLSDGRIMHYKIVPENAADGIWINPFIISLQETGLVKQVMFDCSNRKIMLSEFRVVWENFDFGKPGCGVSDIFMHQNIAVKL